MWKNSVPKFLKKPWSMPTCSCIDFQYISQTMFLVPSQEVISRMDSWRGPNLDKIAYQYLVSQTVLGIFEIPSPSHFLLPHFQKNAQFCENDMFRAISWKRNKKWKSLAPFWRLRLPLRVSKIKKTCLWCSQIETNLSANIIFWTHFRVFRNSPRDIALFLTS